MKILVKCILFISSYFPLYLFVLILNIEQYNTIDKIKTTPVILFFTVVGVCIILSISSLLFINFSKNGTKRLIVENIERPDDTIISYIMTYIIPIITIGEINKYQIIVNVALFILIGYLYIRLNLLYLNPLWSACGYISYRINNDSILITNYKFSELKSKIINKEELPGFYMSNDIFIAKK